MSGYWNVMYNALLLILLIWLRSRITCHAVLERCLFHYLQRRIVDDLASITVSDAYVPNCNKALL